MVQQLTSLDICDTFMMLRVRENRCDCIGDKIGIDISLWDLHPHQWVLMTR